MNENGPIPEGKILCCIDGDSLNCDPSNWELKTRAEHGSRNRNFVKPILKTCPICNKEFETVLRQAKYCSDDCQREKSRIHMREFQRAKREGKDVVTRNCVVCGKEFTPNHMAIKYVRINVIRKDNGSIMRPAIVGNIQRLRLKLKR
jgi:hypothetical protein